MQPVSDKDLDERSKVIYIESDDHIESVNESQNLDGVDEQAKPVGDTKPRVADSLLFGDTGTT